MICTGEDWFVSVRLDEWGDRRRTIAWKSTAVLTDAAIANRRRVIVSTLDQGRLPMEHVS